MAITSKLDAEPLSTDWIISRYGVFITTTQLAKLFGFSGGAAVRRAYSTGRLGIPLMRIEGRRGYLPTRKRWDSTYGDIKPVQHEEVARMT